MTPGDLRDKALCSDDPETVARYWNTAQDITAEWRAAAADIEEHLALVMVGHDVRRLDLPGVGLVERTSRTRRTGWKWDRLFSDVLAVAPEHREVSARTGEAEPAEATALRVLRECVSFTAGKVSGIKRFLPGDVDEYAEVTEAVPAVKLTRFDRSPR